MSQCAASTWCLGCLWWRLLSLLSPVPPAPLWPLDAAQWACPGPPSMWSRVNGSPERLAPGSAWGGQGTAVVQQVRSWAPHCSWMTPCCVASASCLFFVCGHRAVATSRPPLGASVTGVLTCPCWQPEVSIPTVLCAPCQCWPSSSTCQRVMWVREERDARQSAVCVCVSEGAGGGC